MYQNDLKKDLTPRIEILRLMDNLPRLRIILALIIFRKISLTKLSDLLGRAKSTITHHIKKLENLGIIKVTRREARGSIDANVYELIPEFLDIISSKFEESVIEKHLYDKNLKDIISNDILFLKILKILNEQVILYYDAILRKNIKSKPKSFKEFQDSHFKIPLSYDYLFLSEQGREKYEDLYKKFYEDLKEIIKKENMEKGENTRPYLIVSVFYPILQLIEYDSELKEFRKFFQALE